MRTLGWLLAFFNVVFVAVIGWLYVPSWDYAESIALQSPLELSKARNFLADGEPRKALEIIRQHQSLIGDGKKENQAWLELLADVAEEIPDPQQLMLLYEHDPELFAGREKGALLIADEYIKTGQGTAYSSLRNHWIGNEEYAEAWSLLDADRLLLEGQRAAAIALLEGMHFEGKAESSRLTRLGLFHVLADPKSAWEYFSEAIEHNPEDGELYTYRAKLLEAAGSIDLAAEEYREGLEVDPRNGNLRDEAAEFYIRQGDFKAAMDLWSASLTGPSSDALWLKTLFWSKVTFPTDFDWKTHVQPTGTLSPLIDYLTGLGSKEFWNERQFTQLAHGKRFLEQQQATYWLQLLDALKHGHEREAMQLIEYNHFHSRSWNPTLELALMRILNYRQKGSLHLGGLEETMSQMASKTPWSKTPIFFRQLNKTALHAENELPKDIKNLIQSKDAFVTPFLEAGWLEAAIKLQSMQKIPDSFPPEYTKRLAEAIQKTRGNKKALEFITKQTMTPALELLMAELLIAEKSPQLALQHLKRLAELDNEIGKQATELQMMLSTHST